MIRKKVLATKPVINGRTVSYDLPREDLYAMLASEDMTDFLLACEALSVIPDEEVCDRLGEYLTSPDKYRCLAVLKVIFRNPHAMPQERYDGRRRRIVVVKIQDIGETGILALQPRLEEIHRPALDVLDWIHAIERLELPYFGCDAQPFPRHLVGIFIPRLDPHMRNLPYARFHAMPGEVLHCA